MLAKIQADVQRDLSVELKDPTQIKAKKIIKNIINIATEGSLLVLKTPGMNNMRANEVKRLTPNSFKRETKHDQQTGFEKIEPADSFWGVEISPVCKRNDLKQTQWKLLLIWVCLAF